ncbi:hypothetical protein V6Z05_00010 [Leptospira venezuelensis]|uniref:hypothetical protein n=1 Tax=Leptospira venezuelensis TaxID=1958811 RepID=UPI000A3D4CEB|nr:hypothetical protein [Leptospira venezuelensis]
MKTKALSLFLCLLSVSILWNCEGNSSGDTPAILAALLSKKCISVPKKISVIDFNTSNVVIEYDCSVSGKEYLCESANDTQSRVYSSIEGAQLGLINAPGGGAIFCFLPSQRGLGKSRGYQTSNPSNIFYDCSYEYDAAHRLLKVTDQENSAERIYSDYNSQGFPLDLGGDFADYSFGPNSKLPIGIQALSTNIGYNNKGWAVSLEEGPDSYVFDNQGSLQICD